VASFRFVDGRPPERVHEYRNHTLDSTRWDSYRVRDGDVIITTAYKAGTTWMQRIMAALIFGAGPLDAGLTDLSPWIDLRITPLDDLVASLDAQEHRRFVKSHLAADGVEFFPEAKYIVVGRDTRDVFMSMWNHYSGFNEMAYAVFNGGDRPGPEMPRCPESPRELWPRWVSEGWFEWEPDGWPWWSHSHHLSTWWDVRDLPNVLFVHYGDLKRDVGREMRRVAAFCDITVDEDEWPALVAAVGLDAMRTEAQDSASPIGLMFDGGIDRFFYQGTNGRWRDVLDDDDLARYDERAALLDPALRHWLEHGREGGVVGGHH
jgi:aryl sulfotransferase